LASNIFGVGRAEAQAVPLCQLDPKQVILKSTLLRSVSVGDSSALDQYNRLVKTNTAELVLAQKIGLFLHLSIKISFVKISVHGFLSAQFGKTSYLSLLLLIAIVQTN